MLEIRVHCAVLAACIFSTAFSVYAYEIETHKKISEEAASESQFTQFLPIIGLRTLDDPLTDIQTTLSVVEWVKQGANDEDDTISTNFARYRNHFYDPQHGGAGYSFHGLTGEPSPDWALEDNRTFTTQAYSFRLARQYFYDALTLANRDNREMWMARTFYTLGHVIHHIQDMAQPQHTRNDSHGGGPLGSFSRFEKYTDLDNVRGGLPFSDGNYNQNSPVIFDTARKFWDTGDGRGIAEFSSLNFLSAGTNFVIDPTTNAPLYPSPRQADAIAHDENANDLLMSAGLSVPALCSPPNPPCTMKFYTTHVDDKYRPSASGDNLRASTSSIFDQDLQTKNAKPTFSLNRFNFDAAHQFLIPRAVAYSAGLINYFFRGRLEPKDVQYTDSGVSLRVKNSIDLTQTPQYSGEVLTTGGKLVVAFQYKVPDGASGTRIEVGSSNVLTLSEDVPPGQTSVSAYTFTLPALPANAIQLKFQLVYRGPLGAESDAVAAGAFNFVSGFALTPSYTPIDGIGGSRRIENLVSAWRLSDANNVQAGNIDWKGWYQNGVPTKVLSWMGPRARYFKVIGDDSAPTPNIYQNGELWSVAPKPVLGAALTKDDQGNEWVVAICTDGSNDYVYRRPNKKSQSNALDPAPDGWLLLQTFASQNGRQAADVSWFFNGDGTEAQTLRKAVRAAPAGDDRRQVVNDSSTPSGYNTVPAPADQVTYLDRLKIVISGTAVQSSELLGASVVRSSTYNYSFPSDACVENCGHSASLGTCDGIDGNTYVEHDVGSIVSELQATDSGATIVAVDYDEAGEIVAQLTVQSSQHDAGRIDFDTYRRPCSLTLGDITTGSQVYSRNFTSNVKKSLTWRDQQYFLEDHAFDIRYSDSATLTEQGRQDATSESFSAPSVALLTLQYLDLRTNTLLYRQEQRSYRQTDELIYPNSVYQNKKVVYDGTERLVLVHDSGAVTVDEKQNAGIHAYWGGDTVNFQLPVNSNNFNDYLTIDFFPADRVPVAGVTGISNDKYVVTTGVNLYVGSYVRQPYLPTESFAGGVATDSGRRVLASVPRQDDAGNTQWFNYISGGDMTQVIPVAPADAHYDGIGVVD